MEQWLVLNEIRDNPDVFAVFWTQTSVAGDVWKVYRPEIEDYRWYDITKDTEHGFLFDWLKENEI